VRRLFVNVILIAFIAGSAYDTIRDEEHWPFSQCPMFSGVWSQRSFRWLRLFGVTENGGEFALDNLALLLQRQQYHVSDGEPWTNWGLWIAQYPWLSRSMAAIALATETLFPLVLFSRYARLVLVPAGLLFLIGIRALMGPTFEQFMLCYIFWIPWHRLISYRRESVATTKVVPAETHGPVSSEHDVHFVPGR
jgi:hypothetical protein